MPNRILREGILTSPRIARLGGWADEIFYRRLMSVVDDFGRYYADPGMLRAACYPRQLQKVSDSDVGKWLTACVTAALVRVYPAQDGERYLQVLDFGQQVRAKKSKFPEPLGDCYADAAQEHDDREANAPVFGDVSVSVTPLPPEGAAFESFWSEWPSHERKAAKEQCRRKWESKGCEAIADRVIASVKAHKLSAGWLKDGGAFIPAPLTWLNQSRWEAPVEVVANGSGMASEVWTPPPPLTPEERAASSRAKEAALSSLKRLTA